MTRVNSSMDRRGFIKALGSFVALSAVPSTVMAAVPKQSASPVIAVPVDMQNFWLAPREIWLARASTGEEAKICFWKNGQLDVDGYIRACQLLRDVRAGSAVQMDVGLLNLLRAIQGWLVYFNINSPIIINSGYRTAATNGKTEGAAKDSYHMRGQAADITMPGIPTKYLSQLAKSFNAGGMGFYPSKSFVHVDTGRVRSWRG
ncbi:YcbK family protein [Methylobacillus sp. Pita2]|uniref:YcbK family protein n=1 Tax=Methylobacillus sp. Pita2 TaxID=3383245 RepID=UPI0038B55777